MAIVKKNILSIICGVIALIAVIATFWPLGGKFSDLQDKVDVRAGKEAQIRNLLSKSRALPITAPNGAPILLTSFPNKATIEEVRKSLQGDLVEQANSLANAALSYNKATHKLLTQNSLPKPDLSAPFNFQKDLTTALAGLRTDIGGCLPPSQVEIDKAITDLRAEEDKKLQGKVGQATNQESVDKEFNEKAAMIPDQLRQDRAKKNRIYVMPGALEIDPSVSDSAKPPTADMIWYAQVGYWIQQDVCDAIKATNGRSTSIIESPVKSLVRLDLPVSPALYQLPVNQNARSMGGQEAVFTPPDPLSSAGATKIAPIYAISPTGRASNPLYDVVQFNLSVNLDARALEMFVRNLSVNRYVGVRQLNMSRLDLDEENGGAQAGGGRGYADVGGRRAIAGGADSGPVTGFVYGSGVPVARVDLQCEALFLRSWTEPSMPDQVKRDLGIIAPVPGGSPTNTGNRSFRGPRG